MTSVVSATIIVMIVKSPERIQPTIVTGLGELATEITTQIELL